MSELIILDPRRQQIFAPLEEWKILGIQELAKLNEYLGHSYRSVARVAQVFIKAGLLKERYLSGKRKIVYPGPDGQEFLFGQKSMLNLSERQLIHDYLVGRIVRQVSKWNQVVSWVLEHKIKSTHFAQSGDITPDALLKVNIKGKEEWWALELELTQKSQDRVSEKMKAHAIHGKWDRIFYLTNNPAVHASLTRSLENLPVNNKLEKILIGFGWENIYEDNFADSIKLTQGGKEFGLKEVLN